MRKLPHNSLFRIFLLSFAWLTCAFGKVHELELCPRYLVRSPHKITLTDAERFLVCGDPKVEAWNNIPDNQASFHLRVFLQDWGYFSPTFHVEGGKTIVEAGVRTIVSRLTVDGEPQLLDIERMRHIRGEPLTPKLLDRVKDRLQRRLHSMGYPCPKVDMEGNPKTGEVVAHLKSGPKQNVVKIIEEPIPGLVPGVLTRYYAFQVDQPFNDDYLSVTTRRVIDDGVLQSTYFSATCEPDGAHLHQQVVPGPPRQVSIGLGIDTEKLLTTRASWKNSRLGPTASLVNVFANFSFRDQLINVVSDWYWLPYPSRYFLQPSISILHQNTAALESILRQRNQSSFEALDVKVRFAPAMTYDSQTLGFRGSIGPTFNNVHVFRGSGPKEANYVSLRTELSLRDHYFEFYRDRPQSGFELSLESELAGRNVLSNFTAQLYRASFEGLWNFGKLDPPFLVIGMRGGLWLTLTGEDVENPASRLPRNFRQYLGGSTNLRGFGYPDLPGPNGALTAAFGGVEARFPDILPFGLQPFVFTDMGVLGKRSLALEDPIFWSPGVGLRWQAPFGVIRTTFSHGLTSGDASAYPAKVRHPQFYFSFGEEF